MCLGKKLLFIERSLESGPIKCVESNADAVCISQRVAPLVITALRRASCTGQVAVCWWRRQLDVCAARRKQSYEKLQSVSWKCCAFPYMKIRQNCAAKFMSPESTTRLLRRVGTFKKEKNSFTYRHVWCPWQTLKSAVKGKTVPLQAWSGPEGSRKLRFPDFMTTAQDGGQVVSLTHRPPLPPGNAPGTHFC